jgi:purine-binding chemotaxis protein CheW
MTGQTGSAAFALQLRAEFDNGFAMPPRAASAPGRQLLAIGAGGAYAIDLAEITGLQVDRRIVPAPGPVPEWLGLAGIRGELVPVYSLAMLLGHGQPSDAQVRWIALSGSRQRVGLAFETFDGHISLDPGQIAAANADAATEHVRAVARFEHASRPVVSIASVISSIMKRCSALSASKEN